MRREGFVRCLYSFCRNTCLFGWLKDRSGCYTCQCAGRGNEALFEGDIAIVGNMRDFLEEVLEDPSRALGNETSPTSRTSLNLNSPIWNMYQKDSYWIVPYVIENRIGVSGRAAIEGAVREMARYTCVRLQPRTYENKYIYFYNGGRCFSPVGQTLNKQWVSLGRSCWSKGIVLHLIMHSLGFWHEQSRPERDQHVKINFENIRTDMGYNFNKQKPHETNTLASYDIDSIMHASAFEYSLNSQPTITYLNGSAIKTQRERLSKGDIKKVNELYECKRNHIAVVPQEIERCAERDEFCIRLQKLGGCFTYQEFMVKHCFETCKAAHTGCFDMNAYCQQWAVTGYCYGEYSGYMRANCRRSCRLC